MEQCELLPFRELSPYADAIMTAHLLSPLDPAKCATISKKSLDYLKRRIGFNGLVIADSLIMEGIIKQCQSVDNAAIEALNAGCDILILGGLQLNGEKIGYELTTSDVRRIHKAIVQAVKEGRVPEERLDEAVSKILKYKKQYAPTRDQANIKIDMAQNRRLAQKIAEAAYSHYFP